MLQLATSLADNREETITFLESLMYRQAYRTANSGGLAIGTVSKKTVKIVSTINYLHNNIWKSKTTAEIPFVATVDDIAAGYRRKFLFSMDAAGTVTVTPGDAVLAASTALAPSPVANLTAFGLVEILATGTAFDATTDDLDSAWLTVTYTNLGTAPFQSFDAAV